ncbi:MAG: peptidoglycan hydrolase [Bacteroidota bacterium]
MTPISSTPSPAALTASGPSAPSDPEAAAKQFESVLVRQFVEVMTKDLFDGEGEGMLTGQADLQRDTLTDALTEHLVEAGTLGVADLLLAQWARVGHVPASGPDDASGAELVPEVESAPMPPRKK